MKVYHDSRISWQTYWLEVDPVDRVNPFNFFRNFPVNKYVSNNVYFSGEFNLYKIFQTGNSFQDQESGFFKQTNPKSEI